MTNELKIRECCNKPGAERLAEEIKAFWAKKGKKVIVWIETYKRPVPRRSRLSGEEEFETFHCVRSNLVNGLPQ